MEKKKVINASNLPSRFPLLSTVSWITILHYWGAPQWLMGVFGALLAMAWVGYFISFWVEEAIDPFKQKPQNDKSSGSSDTERRWKNG